MADVQILEMERVETYERAESRFEQKAARLRYGKDWIFLFPPTHPSELETTVDISEETRQHGIQSPVQVSGYLYSHFILNDVKDPLKNIETLCHAFLYAVDCDMENEAILVFTVPGNGIPSFQVSAILRGLKRDIIFLDFIR